MDFDEYDYLEKSTVGSGADVLKGFINGSAPKSSRSADQKRRSGSDKGVVEAELDGRMRSKRHHSGDGERDRPEYRDEREHSQYREKSHDRDRDRNRDRSERSHHDRGDRSYRDYRDADRSHCSKDRDRDRDYDREREREAERRMRKERSHSKSRDYERYDRESSKSRSVDRDHRYSREKKKEEPAAKPELADPERDQRTVFAFQISLKADEKDVYDFFSQAGKVQDVKLIIDRSTRRSKGVGYIEFCDAMSVPMAIALTGQLLLGQPVMVKPSEAEKNLVQPTSTTTGVMGHSGRSARHLHVGNLHFNIAEEQLRQVFEPFGQIELVQLPVDSETGLRKGFGFVQYTRVEDARSAQAALNGTLELAGRVIKVVPMTDQNSIGVESFVGPGELDDDDDGGRGLSLITARSRALQLMQKLDRSGTVASVQNISSTAGPVSPVLNVLSAVLGGVAEPIGVPTECLLLSNMFDPSTVETEPDFDVDIKEEVQSECVKYGALKHVFVDKINSAGHVYLRFNNLTSAMSAQRALHGRWFGGKMITTMYMTPQAYEAKFPDSKQGS